MNESLMHFFIRFHRIADQPLDFDFLGRSRAMPGQRTHFGSHDRKAATLLAARAASTAAFNARIKCLEKIDSPVGWQLSKSYDNVNFGNQPFNPEI